MTSNTLTLQNSPQVHLLTGETHHDALEFVLKVEDSAFQALEVQTAIKSV